MSSFHGRVVSVKLFVVFIIFAFASADLKSTQAQGVHNLDTGESFITITEAIDDADTLEGHTISVDPGTYNEYLEVDKQLTLQSTSGNPVDTVITSGSYYIVELLADGIIFDAFTVESGGSSSGVSISNSYCTVSNCIVQDTNYGILNNLSIYTSNTHLLNNTVRRCNNDGIRIYKSPDSVATGNTVSECRGTPGVCGIEVWLSPRSTISDNTSDYNEGSGLRISESSQALVTGNSINGNGERGIEIAQSPFTNMADNELNDNKYNFWVHANQFTNTSYYMQDIDTSNTINGKPIYYYTFEQGIQVPADAGFVGLFTCEDMIVRDLSIANNGTGLLLVKTVDSTIENLDLSHVEDGIHTNGCDNISFSQVNLSFCEEYSIDLYDSHNMTFDGLKVFDNDAGGDLFIEQSTHNTFSNSIFEDNKYAYIHLSLSDYTVIESNIFRQNEKANIRIYNFCEFTQVLNNQFIQNDYCEIWSKSSDHDQIIGNTIDGSMEELSFNSLIDLEYAQNAQVLDNTLQNSEAWGIVMEDCSNCNIEGNKISGCDNEAAVLIDSCQANSFKNNNLKDNLYGFQVIESNGNTLENNILFGMWRGMMVENSDTNTIKGNTFLECSDIELMLQAGCNQNVVYNNDFLATVLRVYDVGLGNQWDNGYPVGGNYWSTYNGVDVDGDGIGDTSIEVLPAGNNNYDRYPLMTPANLTLFNDKDTIQESVGGQINLTVEAGKGNAFRKYLVVGGLSGTDPGQPLPGGLATLPVNFDAFTYNVVLPFLNTPLFVDFLGTLDAYGRAYPTINAPAVPGFAGNTMYYAFCCNNPFDFASNYVSISVIP